MRLVITFATLLAFILQTLVLQTHIHGTARIDSTAASQVLEKGVGQQPDKFPPADDPANCPICQELLHAGAFVAPTAATLQLATLVAVIDLVFVEIFAATKPQTHGWKSRAPPPA